MLADHAAEYLPPPDWQVQRGGGLGFLVGRALLAGLVGSVPVVGVQPDLAGWSVDTRYGYPDQLATTLRRRDPGLQLVKLGCPGETTTTMIGGRHCPYAAGSQLAAAVRFLRAGAGAKAIGLDLPSR